MKNAKNNTVLRVASDLERNTILKRLRFEVTGLIALYGDRGSQNFPIRDAKLKAPELHFGRQ